jgi:hypothetical protein
MIRAASKVSQRSANMRRVLVREKDAAGVWDPRGASQGPIGPPLAPGDLEPGGEPQRALASLAAGAALLLISAARRGLFSPATVRAVTSRTQGS